MWHPWYRSFANTLEGRSFFPETRRATEVLHRLAEAAELFENRVVSRVLLALTLRGWEAQDLCLFVSNRELTDDSEVDWRDCLMATRWLNRTGFISIGERVDYAENRDRVHLTFLEGIPWSENLRPPLPQADDPFRYNPLKGVL